MEFGEDHLFQQNRSIDERLDYLIYTISSRLDKLCKFQTDDFILDSGRRCSIDKDSRRSTKDPCSSVTFMTFRAPYIRDFRNFSGPINEDIKQLQQLPTGVENIDQLIRQKAWSKEAKQQLKDSVIENYSRNHMIKLIKHKNQLLDSKTIAAEDVAQKVQLIDEQIEQVKSRNDFRIFVPADRHDKQIDWLAISAKSNTYQHESTDCRLMWSNQLHWSINDNDWTKDEDVCLIDAVAKYGKNNWDLIADELNSGRLPWQCCARYHQEYASIQSSFHPGSEETEKILEVINLCRIGSFVPWNQVMYFMQYHNLHQIKYQWQRFLEQEQGTERNSRAWSEREDLLLFMSVAKYGEKDWYRIAGCVPGRSNKSCRERYKMRLRFPKRIVGSWRKYEDHKLLSLIEEYGPTWSIVTEHFPERNNHQIRNRYELLKSDEATRRKGLTKHRKLYRKLTPESVDYVPVSKRHKSSADIDIDRKLHEIFTTYKSIDGNNSSKKSLTYRSSQDEQIYQSLVEKLCDKLLGIDKAKKVDVSNLDLIMGVAVDNCTIPSQSLHESSHTRPEISKSCTLAPAKPTIQGYKVWSLQQDYLKRKIDETDKIKIEDIDDRILRMVVGIFLFPAILSKLEVPQIDPSQHQIGSVIDKQSKNLYKIRNLQSNLLKK